MHDGVGRGGGESARDNEHEVDLISRTFLVVLICVTDDVKLVLWTGQAPCGSIQ